ncbi:MAG TPA: transglycosylase domain-containing protein [Acidimicrobiia bacterium]|nr:transglycosylase domain-containing protein [Acidimicrobiia bacterium]
MPANRDRRRIATALVGTVVMTSLVVGGVTAAFTALGRGAIGHALSAELPTPKIPPLALRSVVYDDANKPIATLSGPQDRAYVTLPHIAPVLKRAVLAAEDRTFYHHGGVDWRSVARAMTQNLHAGTILQGGSTIAQQLVKNTLFRRPARDVQRKVREAVLAIALERQYSKDQIFEAYLNTVYFGNGAYGVEAAAERYFGRTAATVDLAQSTLLGAMIANPSKRNPIAHPDEAARSRARVLTEMVKAHWTSSHAALAAQKEPLPRSIRVPQLDPPTDAFVEEVKQQLLADPRLGSTASERYRQVFAGGLRIYTTLDRRLEADAVEAATVLPTSAYTTAMVVLDNSSGAVRAIYPGGGFQNGGFDLATQGARQTGSAFKAITLAAALDNGFSPNDMVDANGHCTLVYDPRVPPWTLQNFEGESLGTVTLTKAIAQSSNCAFARVAIALGPSHIVDMAHELGITRPLDAVPSITLGTEEVSPLDMAQAFSVFAADGVRHTAHFIVRVEDRNGHVLFANGNDATRVLPPQIARTETEMLGHVISEGTAHNSLGDWGRPAAGKTGTNDQSRDVWFVGYTPQLTTAVWVGNPSALVPVVLDGVQQVGGNYPARICRAFMTAALVDAPALGFPPPNPFLWPPARMISEFGLSAVVPSSPRPSAPSSPTVGSTAPPPATPPHQRHRPHK